MLYFHGFNAFRAWNELEGKVTMVFWQSIFQNAEAKCSYLTVSTLFFVGDLEKKLEIYETLEYWSRKKSVERNQ